MYLNGLMLVSVILDFQTARFDLGNDLPFLLFLPTYAATALYHNKVTLAAGQDRQSFLAAVEAFALRDYALALLQGDRLADAERQQIIQQLAAYTGLTPTYLHETNLRIQIQRFVKELLRTERRTVGRLDTRFQGIDRDAAGETFEFDPSYAAIQGPYTATLNDYVRRELNFASDLPYEILTGLYESWDYSSHQNQYVNVAETLRSAMSKNPFLRVLVANGYYDLATPYFATEYTFNHLALDPTLQRNIIMTYYEAGHMMYLHEPSLHQLSEDLHAFITNDTDDIAANRPEG
jgi:carboxypeptidase C (cathepsin A)